MVIGEALSLAVKILSEAKVFDPDFEAREILREITELDPYINSRRELSAEQQEKILQTAEKRATGVPLQYIFGKWEFYGYPFYVGEGVLIPRPETELLIDIAKKYCNENSAVIDLCSGSGCIPISISLETGANTLGIELYDKAFGYFERNIALNRARVTAIKGDVLDEGILPDMEFDAIFSNPPYLTAEEMKNLQREVGYEPETALFGGEDGLYFYRRIIPLWVKRLKKGGIFAVEIGETQGEAVKAIMEETGLSAEVIKDYSGLQRVVLGKRIL